MSRSRSFTSRLKNSIKLNHAAFRCMSAYSLHFLVFKLRIYFNNDVSDDVLEVQLPREEESSLVFGPTTAPYCLSVSYRVSSLLVDRPVLFQLGRFALDHYRHGVYKHNKMLSDLGRKFLFCVFVPMIYSEYELRASKPDCLTLLFICLPRDPMGLWPT